MKYLLFLAILACGFTSLAQTNSNASSAPVVSSPQSQSLLVQNMQASLLNEDIEVAMLAELRKGWGFVGPDGKLEIFPYVNEPNDYNTGMSYGFDSRQYSLVLTFQKLTAKGWRLYGSGNSGVAVAFSYFLVRSKGFKEVE